MNCGELERLFLAGAAPGQVAAHRDACGSCAAVAADLDATAAMVSVLKPPAAASALLARLRSIPSRTVSCEKADLLLAAAMDGEISPADRERLAFHTSRCEACSEAAAVLAAPGGLVAPAPAPWVLGRLAAGRPQKPRRAIWRLAASPKGAIALAYAAAVVVMLSGFNPAELARKAGVDRLEQNARLSAQLAGRSLGDRLGALEEDALRKLAAWKGRAAGYGRAALSRAIQLVMKTEPEPAPRRGKTGDEKGLLKRNERTTWRA